MQALEICRKYYKEYGREMIHSRFPEYENVIAVGIAGPGSDCFGFDDKISRDHDWGAGFCLWLDDETYDKIGFELARAYSELPDEIDGVKKYPVRPYGKDRFGVMKISDFFLPLTGSKGAPESNIQWLNIPDFALATAVNGEIFRDDPGKFTEIRKKIMNMPDDVRLKKISARAIAMAQSGQYNFSRCMLHGEKAAAALALSEFVREAAILCYTLEGRYAPFYKWIFRGIDDLDEMSFIKEKLENLITGEISLDTSDKIEDICREFADRFRREGISSSGENFLEPHAYQIREKIRDNTLRNLHIMEG